MNYNDMEFLAVPLPEDILKEKMSGNLEKAVKIIHKRLEKDIPLALRKRLEMEIYNIEHLPNSFTIPYEEAVNTVIENIENMTEEEFEEMVEDGKTEWMYINGKKYFHRIFYKNLMKVYPEYAQRAKHIKDKDVVDDIVENIKDGETMCSDIHISHKVKINKENIEDETLKIHIPFPVEREGLSEIKIIDVKPDPKAYPSLEDGQPTIYFESMGKENTEFYVEYSLKNKIQYMDMWKYELKEEDYANIPEEIKEKYCKEQLSHIRFTPYLKSLAKEIVGDEKNPLEKARKIYEFITTKVIYSFMREYGIMNDITEFCAANMKGDCGVQALLFITLCRISGVPAMWQSGLVTEPGYVGQHDWTMFYVPGLGFRYADLSAGGAAYRAGNDKKHKFYFGNMDTYRIQINNEFQCDLLPTKKFRREDPYDNQCGEGETLTSGLYGSEIRTSNEEKSITYYIE